MNARLTVIDRGSTAIIIEVENSCVHTKPVMRHIIKDLRY